MKYAARICHAELGARFDIRAFHDQLLSQGGLPLDLLDTRMRGWVAEQKRLPAGRALSLQRESQEHS